MCRDPNDDYLVALATARRADAIVTGDPDLHAIDTEKLDTEILHHASSSTASSQWFGPKRWPSHKDHAAKALAKVTGPHLPAALKQLEKAIAKAHAELHDAQDKAHAHKRKRPHKSSDDANAGQGGDEPTTVDADPRP